jgi:hypothetical protein
MTEKLKTLLHERASSVDFVAPDLDAMVRVGDRQVRRRRGLGIAAGLAAAVVTGLVVPVLRSDAPRDQLAVEPASTAPLTWVSGSVLHTPDSETDLGFAVQTYVRTASGYVFADTNGTVWSRVGGATTEVGRAPARDARLVSDTEGTLAGWVDPSGDRPAFVVLDQSTGKVTRYDEHTTSDMALLADESDPAVFSAIDDGSAYWRDQRGAVVVDLAGGEVRVVDADAGGFDLGPMEDGLFAFRVGSGTAIGEAPDDIVRRIDAYGELGSFSPDARYFSSDANQPQVYDVASGRRVSFDLEGRGFATGYEWLDDRTIAMLAARRPTMDAKAELLTCTVPEGTCEPVAELGTFERIQSSFALPIGQSIAAE